jgi:predicted ATPase
MLMRKVLLKSIQANSGFLEQCKVEFSPELTCIIGARGTCKSTVVESVRFAFDSDRERVTELTAHTGMITKTLGPGSVQCVVEVTEDGQATEYVIEREIGGPPRVLRDGTRDMLGNEILNDIEIYSQGSLQQIASIDMPHLRLQLIDRPHRVEILVIRQKIDKMVAELKILGSRLRSLRADFEKRRLEIRDIDQLRAELGQAIGSRPQLPPTLEEQHALFLQRQKVLEVLGEAHSIQQQTIADLAVAMQNGENLVALRAVAKEIPAGIETPLGILDQLDNAITSITSSQRNVSEVKLTEEAERIKAQFEKENEVYYQLRQQQQVLNESLKREDALRRRVSELEKIEREAKKIETEGIDAAARRRAVRAELATARDSIFERRVQEAEKINQEFGEVILLSVRRAAHSKPFVDRLSELLAGSRIRTQGNIAEELATSLSPSDLLDVIERGDAQRLAGLLSRDLGQITRVVTYLRDNPDLYDLEGELFEDSLEITMFDRGQPKPVEQLSEGQRATALLPLILRESTCPLIVDQPEDDLDNSFIFDVLVRNVLRLKKERQLIFVTHNANIPVLGDAEAIVVMHMEKPTKAAPPVVGSLDERTEDILRLLEGGKEAFERREAQYGSLLR